MGEGQKVVIDTNVFISAFGWGGKPYKIMELLEKRVIRNCISEEILSELIKSLAYPKLQFSQQLQSSIVEFVLAYSDIYEPNEKLTLAPDADDNKFIECAIEANAGVIITGDRSFLSLKQVKGIEIMSPEKFLEVIEYKNQ